MAKTHTAVMTAGIRYATAPDGISIAYQVIGDGPRDLVWVPGWISHLEAAWEEPTLARFFERLASFSRLILFDKRGTGLSDRVAPAALPTLETRMSDLLTVCDAVGSERAALLGVSEGAPMCVLFAATHPARTTAMILLGGFAREMAGEDHPWAMTAETLDAFLDEVAHDWGGPVGLEVRAPSRARDERFRGTWARYLRQGASPAAVTALATMNAAIDVRPVLGSVHVPTLVLHRIGDRAVPIESGRYLAAHIPGALLRELPGEDHLPWVGDANRVLDEIEEFLTGVRQRGRDDRVLATVLFTDIVGSTERAAELGDLAWTDLLRAHHAIVRAELERFAGNEVDTAGDGFFATFDGPARAIRCALAIGSAVHGLGLRVRAGIHTGEVELASDGIGGMAVHIGARIGALAGPDEVLVSRTVRDLVVGSGIAFVDRGTATLKGVPDDWQLYAAQLG